MSDRARIAEVARAGVTDAECPFWRGWPGACSRWEDDGNDHFLIYSPRAGGLFRRRRDLAPLDLTDAGKAAVSSEVYFTNLSGSIPDLDALIEKAGEDRPDHRGRISLLLLAIAGAEDAQGDGLRLGRRRPERIRPDGVSLDDPFDFDLAFFAATACIADRELVRAVHDAQDEQLIELYFVDPENDPETGDEIAARLLPKGAKAAAWFARKRNLSSRPTLEAALNGSRVTFIPDTNIFCQFKPMGDVAWRDLCPNAEDVRIIAPVAVVREMDKHKNTSDKNRLRKRGRDFAQLQRRLEENHDAPIVLRERGPRVTFEIGAQFRTSELDGDHFDLADPDGRIVAEAARLAETEPAAILLADDGNPLLYARHAGLLSKRPPEGWRLPDPPDEKDRIIAEQAEQLGAQPKLHVGEDTIYTNEDGVFAFQALENTDTPEAFAAQIAEKVLALNPRASDEYLDDLLRRYLKDGLKVGNVTPENVERYKWGYEEYKNQVSAYAQNFVKQYAKTAFILPVRFVAENKGMALATDIVFEAELQGDFEFLSEAYAMGCFGDAPAAPEAPSPVMRLGRGLDPAFPQPAAPVDPFDWRWSVSPDRSANPQHIEWRCGCFRHGDAFSPYAFIAAKDGETASGVLRLRLRAGNLARAAEAEIPIRAASGKTPLQARHLWSAALFVDGDARRAVWDAVSDYVGAGNLNGGR